MVEQQYHRHKAADPLQGWCFRQEQSTFSIAGSVLLRVSVLLSLLLWVAVWSLQVFAYPLTQLDITSTNLASAPKATLPVAQQGNLAVTAEPTNPSKALPIKIALAIEVVRAGKSPFRSLLKKAPANPSNQNLVPHDHGLEPEEDFGPPADSIVNTLRVRAIVASTRNTMALLDDGSEQTTMVTPGETVFLGGIPVKVTRITPTAVTVIEYPGESFQQKQTLQMPSIVGFDSANPATPLEDDSDLEPDNQRRTLREVLMQGGLSGIEGLNIPPEALEEP